MPMFIQDSTVTPTADRHLSATRHATETVNPAAANPVRPCPPAGPLPSLGWASCFTIAGVVVIAVGWVVMHWASARLVPDPVGEARRAAAVAQAELARELASRPVVALDPAAVARGKKVYMTCMARHGKTGEGIKMTGADLLHSKFVARKSDEELLNFVKTGRTPNDPDSVLKLNMPPKGGNPALKDEQIRDVIAYVRSLQQAAANQH